MRKLQTEYIKINTHKCKACWDCIEECQKGVLGKIHLWFHKYVVIKNADECCGCQKCIAVCPNGVFEPVVQINAVVNK